MTDVLTLISSVQGQIGTEASRPTILALMNEVYMTQVADSRWLVEELTLGTTVAGTNSYVVPTSPEIIEITGLKVGGYSWDRVGEDEMWDLTAWGSGNWTGRYGSYAPTYSSTGALSLTMYPTPTSSGATLVARAAVLPAPLTDGVGVPVTPSDSHSSLVDGAIGLILMRVDERPDLAQWFSSRSLEWTEKLRRRKNSIVRGKGPVQVQVQGYHF